jgi:hypothetical protein
VPFPVVYALLLTIMTLGFAPGAMYHCVKYSRSGPSPMPSHGTRVVACPFGSSFGRSAGPAARHYGCKRELSAQSCGGARSTYKRGVPIRVNELPATWPTGAAHRRRHDCGEQRSKHKDGVGEHGDEQKASKREPTRVKPKETSVLVHTLPGGLI